MDAVSLALPVNNLPNATMAGGDNPGLGTDGDPGAMDFATLLAAGIDLQQQLFDTAGAPTTEATDAATLEADPAALAADPTSTPAELPALPMSAQITERPATAQLRGGEGDAGGGRATAALLSAGDTRGTQSAADAARIAASAAAAATEETAGAETPEFRLDAGKEMQSFVETTDAQRTDAAESAVQSLNVQSSEQRPAVQQQPVAVREVGAPVGSAGFADELSRQVVWMVDKDAQIAELRINPPDLGPVEVRLSVSGDHATAQFVAAQAEVREALETSLARLRESFAEAGIQLGEASVGAESFREQTAGQSETRNGRTGYADNGPSLVAGTTSSGAAQRVQRGLVDTFV